MSKYTYTHLDLFLIRNVDDDVKQLGIIMAFSRANFHQGGGARGNFNAI